MHNRRTKTNLNLPTESPTNRKEFSISEYLSVPTSDLSVIYRIIRRVFIEYLSAILFYYLYFVLTTQRI